MIRVTVLYPNDGSTRFDAAYYLDVHMATAKKLLAPYGLVRIEVDKALSGPMGSPAPFAGMGHLYFSSLPDWERALQAHAGDLQADVPNFTDAKPQIQISEIVPC